MYFNILKKDLKRKKSMNVVLFIFIIFVTIFISSSINNIVTITGALDNYKEESNVGDYITYALFDDNQETEFDEVLNANGFSDYKKSSISMINKDMLITDNEFFSDLGIGINSVDKFMYNVFDSNDNKIEQVNDEEVYLTNKFLDVSGLKIGDKIRIEYNDTSLELIVKGSYKDVFNSSTFISMTNLLVSEKIRNEITEYIAPFTYTSYSIKTTNISGLENLLNSLNYSFIFQIETNLTMLYMFDMLVAGIMLIVSIFLMCISLVILRFTIVFTINEETKQIGIMKAIGIKNSKISNLYTIKYFVMGLVGTIIGFILGIIIGNIMLKQVSDNIPMRSKSGYLINILASILVLSIIMFFCRLTTRKIKKINPITAIRSGANKERFKEKGKIKLSKSRKLNTTFFLSLNDLLSDMKRTIMLVIIFSLGMLFIQVPITSINTLKSDNLIDVFAMVKSDVYLSDGLFTIGGQSKEDVINKHNKIKEKLKENGIDSNLSQEILFKFNIAYKNKTAKCMAYQGLNTNVLNYPYLEGTAPRHINEIGLSKVTAKKIGAEIGDQVLINLGDREEKFIVTSLFQSMSNLGEAIRFHEDLVIDYKYLIGSFAIQVKFLDNYSNKEKEKKMDLIKTILTDYNVYNGGEFIASNIGIGTQMDLVERIVIILVLLINVLVIVLMVKSFIAKEENEISLCKAMGFKNNSIIFRHTLRIGLVIFISILIAIFITNPITKLTSGQIFKMMGASKINFHINILENYIIYPLLMFIISILVAFLTSQSIRKITTLQINQAE